MNSAATRVGINLLWLVPGEVGGSEEYTVRLLTALADRGSGDVEIILYVNRRFADAHGELSRRFTTRVAPTSGSSRVLRVLIESTWLAVRARTDRCRIVHHAGGTMPAVRTVPGIVTIHDLQPLSNPERFGLIKRAYIRWSVPRSLRRARKVVCLSTFVADDVRARADVESDRIAIVPCGVADPGAAFDRDRAAGLLDSLGLRDHPFVLYPAITYPHKNHVTLVAAFAQVIFTHQEARLVLTGGRGQSEDLVESTIAAYGLDATVVRTGRIPEDDLDLLYRSASLMAFPSLYEGFGVPVLEAMARGCPVVAGDAGALPEVVGDVGILIDPIDVAGWAEAITSLIADQSQRAALARTGFDRARLFTWPASAEALLSVYRETT